MPRTHRRQHRLRRVVFARRAKELVYGTKVEGHVIRKHRTKNRMRFGRTKNGGGYITVNTQPVFLYTCSCGFKVSGIFNDSVVPHLKEIGAEYP